MDGEARRGTLATRPIPNDSNSGDSDSKMEVEEVVPFQADFERVVKQDDLRFAGDFAHGKQLPHAPNPCIHVEGLGTIGLPLNDTEARRVLEYSGPVCEIEGSRVTFQSPIWKQFFNELVKSTCESLGALLSLNVPICELRKLTLCHDGTPSYRVEKTGFATLVILLPSCYTGGRAQVSHDGSTRTFDFTANSPTDTCMFAWYNETSYTVDAITSGYQLALVYDIIPTSSAFPRLPVLQPAVSELQKVLQRWSEGYYPDHSELNLIAIVLTNKYDGEDLSLKTLTGGDHKRASHIYVAAEEMGYVVGLAKSRYRNIGTTYEDYSEHCECCRQLESDAKEAEMSEPYSSFIDIENMVDFAGSPIPRFTKLDLSKANLILDSPFETQRPDYATISLGFDDKIIHDYLRSVLFLFHKSQEFSLLLASGDLSSALQKIRDSPLQDKTPENVLVVNHILKHGYTQGHREALAAVAGYGLLWKDINIWKRGVENLINTKSFFPRFCPYELIGKEDVLKACSTFHFDDIQTTLTAILDSGATFRDQMEAMKVLRTGSSEENVTKWCDERMSLILTSLQKINLSVDDAPALLSVIADRGLTVLTDVILPQLCPQAGRDPDFGLWIALIQGLYDQKNALTASDSGEVPELSQNRDGNSFQHVIDMCFTTVMQQRQSMKSPAPRQSMKSPTPHVTHAATAVLGLLIDLLDLCITNGNLDACNAIFRVAITREEGSPDDQFENLYRPLVPTLLPLLTKHSLSFCAYPFKDFIRFIIEQRLHHLGRKPSETPTMRRIGCGCQVCAPLDEFMFSNTTSTEFSGPRQQGQHLEQRIAGASDIVTSSRIRTSDNKNNRSFKLAVTKKTQTSAFAQWQVRQKEAESFLSSVGDGDVIAAIMGARAVDVRLALTGVAVFAVDPSVADMFRSQPSTTTVTAATSNTTTAAKNTTLPAVGACPTNLQGMPMLGIRTVSGVGSKRKRDGDS